jgi:hypothetical protein
MEKMWKEAVVACFEELSQYFRAGNEEFVGIVVCGQKTNFLSQKS